LEFSGIGEPLLHKEFKKFASYAGDKHTPNELALGLVSNGNLLTEDIRDFLIQQKFGYAWFSLNAATSKTHSKLMPGLDFEKIIGSIHELIALRNKFGLKIPVVRVSFVVTKENYFEAEDFIDLAIGLGADKITIGCVDAVLEPTVREQQHISIKEFASTFERIEDRARKDRRISHVPRWVLWSEIYKQPGQENAVAISCGNVDEVFGVYLPSGEVVFCCYMAAEMEKKEELGNIYEQSALEIWNGIPAQTFAKSMRDLGTAPTICKRCLNFWNKKWEPAQPPM